MCAVARLEVLTALKMRVVTPCSIVGGYRCFEGTYCLAQDQKNTVFAVVSGRYLAGVPRIVTGV
jgi:hypothetical protein